jgi:hypothetical protein
MDKTYLLNYVNPELFTIISDDIYYIRFTSEPDVTCVISISDNTALFNDGELVNNVDTTVIYKYLI